VAEVVDVSVRGGGAIKVDRVVCAVDCGVAVNPDVIRAQMEGGIGYGLGAAMRNKITLTNGVVDQANFPDYEPLRMADMPKVEVHIVSSKADPTGVGEPGLPPLAPALANAIHAATGKRVTTLPFTDADPIVTETTELTVTEEEAFLMPVEGMSAGEVAEALNKLMVTPRDMIAIFQALRQAGALEADLEIM